MVDYNAYYNQKYRHHIEVAITFGDEVWHDFIKGLNEGHAMWRAKQQITQRLQIPLKTVYN